MEFSKEELVEAARLLGTDLSKQRMAAAALEGRGKRYYQSACIQPDRRIRALEIARRLIERELAAYD